MLIELENLTFSYQKRLPPVLCGLNAVFESRGIALLTGANGSGKTTLANLILGILKPCAGSIKLDGKNAVKMSPGARANRIGYLFQNPDLQLFAPTVEEELSFPFELSKTLTEEKKALLKELIKKFGLSGMETRFPLGLSGGEKQRLALAALLSKGVEYLILDEPTSALDAGSKEDLIHFINDFSKNNGVLVMSHDEDLADALEDKRVLRLEGGRLYEA
jgi:energy-coupling factor transport system ATP-binding protein